jgi:hypothetical protein
MKRISLIAIALAVIFSGNGYARDKSGDYYLHAPPDCREFLEGYATAKFIGTNTSRASTDFHQHKTWIFGFVSAYNMYYENGKKEVLSTANMSANDTLRWLEAWCRDNMSKNLFNATQALLLRIDDDFIPLRK